MVTPEQVSWGRYGGYEGGVFRGTPQGRFVLSSSLTDRDRQLAVITAIEGGNYMATQGYDAGIMSTGLIQWIERRQFSVSWLLGCVAKLDLELLQPIWDVCSDVGVTFRPTRGGHWRFHTKGGGEITTEDQQSQLFRLSSNGKLGTWNEASRRHQRMWVAAIASVWESPRAQAVQAKETADRLDNFCLPFSKGLLQQAPVTVIGRAFKALYLSFAINNPSLADKWLQEALKTARPLGYETWGLKWLAHVAKNLTFGPGISIYPKRYNEARPVLERLYGVDLPDFANEFDEWFARIGHDRFLTPLTAQEALIRLGYDCGPSGADGIWGKQSAAARKDFEQDQGLVGDGILDPVTCRVLARELDRIDGRV